MDEQQDRVRASGQEEIRAAALFPELEDDEREDVKMMAMRYAQMLNQLEGTWKSEDDFYTVSLPFL